MRKDYRFLKVNSALCKMAGYSEAELLQLSYADITYGEDLPTGVGLSEQLFKGETPFYQLQKQYVKKNGELISIKLRHPFSAIRKANPFTASPRSKTSPK